MRTDSQIKEDVLEELAWRSNIDETEIGVIVKDGIVTLNGIVDSYAKKIAAEQAAKSVFGVKAVAEDIEVNFRIDKGKTDSEIAKAVVDELISNSSIPHENIKVKVENAWVYLSGEVEWSYQINAAKIAIENLFGIKGVINSITLNQIVDPVQGKSRIKKGF